MTPGERIAHLYIHAAEMAEAAATKHLPVAQNYLRNGAPILFDAAEYIITQEEEAIRLKAERQALRIEVERLQISRIGDAEIIGRWMGEAESREKESVTLKATIALLQDRINTEQRHRVEAGTVTMLAARCIDLEELLKKAKQFIEYARYELQPGIAKLGDQFPKQGDADKILSQITAAILNPKAPHGSDDRTDPQVR